jgi:hypothetical protein
MSEDPTRRDMLARIDASWDAFRAAVKVRRGQGFDATTHSGWTVRAVLAHVGAWHDATADRLRRFAATGRGQPKVEADDDVFNARVAAETADRRDDQVVADLDRSFARFRAAVGELPGFSANDDGWVEAVVAGNSYEHYTEHLDELRAAAPADA